MNAVMGGRSRTHEPAWHPGALSIKFVVSGEGCWITDEGEFRLTGDQFLVLNEGQRYALDIKSPEPTETFCVFFKPGFVEDVARARLAKLDEDAGPARIGFPTRMEPRDSSLVPALVAFRGRVKNREIEEPGEVEDAFLAIAEKLLEHHVELAREPLGLARTEAVRVEIHRRLSIARDFMIANLHRGMDLEEIASVAYLSPFHFHRLFRQAFGETPHQFLTRIRVARAQRLLNLKPASEVCVELGFSSYASFSHLIKRTTGRRPSEQAPE